MGNAERAESLKIRWPDGGEQTLTPEGADRLIIVEQPGRVTP